MLVLEEPKAMTREHRITNWYLEVFPKFAQHIRKRGGSLEEAREIFQEAIVLYFEKSMQAAFTPQVSDQAYLMGMARNLWLKHLAAKKQSVSLDGIDLSTESTATLLTHKLLAYLQQSGAKCMDVLQAFYYEKLNMKEIAVKFGYTSEHSATVQKFKCLEKVRNEVQQKTLSYEDFLD